MSSGKHTSPYNKIFKAQKGKKKPNIATGSIHKIQVSCFYSGLIGNLE